jgi:alkylhydroperoxidase family enzyme
MNDLITLDPAKFERREWVALAWARDWALFHGEFPDQELVREFESLYSEQQRRDILAVATVMDFANRFMNTTTGKVNPHTPAPAP